MDTQIVLLLAVAVLLVAVVGWYLVRTRKSARLRQQFGPEYDKTVNTFQDRQRAEAELAERERRVRKYEIVSLPAADCSRYRESWLAIQNRFVDHPESAVVDANRLVQEVMRRCGYPVGDFEQSAADLSVDHPAVVENYRAANRIALRSERGKASTEELRQALVHFRELFEDLLDFEAPARSDETLLARVRSRKTPTAHQRH